MVAAGARALRAWWRIALGIYLAEAAVALLFTLVVWRTLGALYGDRPLFDRGVAGDATALALALKQHRSAVVALAWAGGALVLGWALLSFYLGPGLLGAFAGRAFGTAARRQFWAFVRLSLWSLIPLVLTLAIAGIGAHLTGATDPPVVDRWRALATLRGAIPGLLLVAAVACAIDYARADLVARDATGAGRALLRALRLTFTSPLPIAHYVVYGLALAALAALYLVAGAPLAGAFLFAVRQLFLAARFAARAIATGGQLELVRSR
ncbi:MAG TPA: hypothetical protein VKE22_28340 [Haliangiales bacterium]|nr:hypothetical protein [Haliangiales bacterium]